jgi:hypothetical protein
VTLPDLSSDWLKGAIKKFLPGRFISRRTRRPRPRSTPATSTLHIEGMIEDMMIEDMEPHDPIAR